ncbi:TPA: hypothetical protein U1C15_001899 [Streptococcus suis]|nr:hypothetical protein [Streptococcus suis]
MDYLTREEFVELGFEIVDNFEALSKRAEIAINLYTQGFYQQGNDFEADVDFRKKAVKLAMAFQIAYLDGSGVMTADDKQNMASVSIGRTSINYGTGRSGSAGQQFNLCLDAENALKSAGFSLIVGVAYDR